MPANIPLRIKQRRKELGLSQAALAKACNVGQSTVANWERGGHIPRQAKLHLIAAALKTDEVWLLSGEDSNARKPLGTYLNKPIRHVAVYDWPENAQAFEAVIPLRYFAHSTEHEDVFALALSHENKGFKTGTVLAFTRIFDETEPGWFLELTPEDCNLSEGPSAHTAARLIYSIQSH